ncbi:MAG: DUF2851 family protein [Verrucomicrobiota bacterium]
MSPPPDNFYADWRPRFDAGNVLRDENDPPPERLLQAIWHHQRLQRDRLQTADGKSVRVLHPGFASVEGGPDFRGAVIQIGDDAPCSGDVEIDLRVGGWRAHGHDRNPDFKNVVLHVVWDETVQSPKSKAQSPLAVLSLNDKLDAPLAELALWLENDSPRVLPENLRGQCCLVLRELDETRQGKILDAAARVRFQAKAGQFRARARHVGWEQALWEGLFRALGYKHNLWPMQNLAESRLRWAPGADTAFALQARLLGISGLLPAELPRAQAGGDGYLRRVWDCWWRERDAFSDCILPRTVWKFHGLRPANHPQRRLALAAHWLADKNLISKIENWSVASVLSDCSSGRESALTSNHNEPAHAGCYEDSRKSHELLDSLREILEVERDEFWSWHWTFRSARLKKPQPLLGDARVTDLAVNVILPWLWTRAAEGKNGRLQRVIEHRYAVWPQAEDNSILKLARQRLLGVGRSRALRSAAAQQGLIQITRDFCAFSNAVCENCRFPELVRGWNGDAGFPPVEN